VYYDVNALPRYDIAIFISINFMTHAATVIKYPGESGVSYFRAVVLALIFPTSGAVRGLTALVRRGGTGVLEKATRAGALCMVVRSEFWEPADQQEVSGLLLRPRMRPKQRRFGYICVFLMTIANVYLQRPHTSSRKEDECFHSVSKPYIKSARLGLERPQKEAQRKL